MDSLISIIIPAYNEENSIIQLLKHLEKNCGSHNCEIIVVDGQSTDNTAETVRSAGYTCIESPVKGRAKQLNLGAKHSNGGMFYFVHADCYPPHGFSDDIVRAVNTGYRAGCYRFRFKSNHPLLKINSYFTRYNRIMCRGGDQTLFITKSLFYELGGFSESYKIMEDFDMIQRIQSRAEFRIIPRDARVSARKYEENSYLKVNFINFVIFMMYFGGASQDTLVHAYSNLIRNTKFR